MISRWFNGFMERRKQASLRLSSGLVMSRSPQDPVDFLLSTFTCPLPMLQIQQGKNCAATRDPCVIF